MTEEMRAADVAVVGGGIGGLAAAALLARQGRSVLLFEKSKQLGGRAVTQEEGGFRFNIGPHALYRGSAGMEVLRELGVRVSGRAPNASGGYAVRRGAKHALPGGLVSLLTTGLFGLSAKLETARLLGSFATIDAAALAGVPLRGWVERTIRNPEVRELVFALVRLSNYANDPERQCAGAAIGQLQMALRDNVLYLDGGWQSLVDGLREVALSVGVRVVAGCKVVAVEHGAEVSGVRLADGTRVRCSTVVVAADPAAAGALVGEQSAHLRRVQETASPVRAACLDVGLTHLPRPKALFALGIDRPLYFSVHSAYANLAPQGAAAVHVAKYLPPDANPDAAADQQELEDLLDLVQPGWRAAVAERRFLPNMTVAHALVTAAGGGLSGRPAPRVPDLDGLYVVGDWVGAEGMLADAALASARAAARDIAARSLPRAAA
jgi:phytoene dehydrogenase-like protein